MLNTSVKNILRCDSWKETWDFRSHLTEVLDHIIGSDKFLQAGSSQDDSKNGI